MHAQAESLALASFIVEVEASQRHGTEDIDPPSGLPGSKHFRGEALHAKEHVGNHGRYHTYAKVALVGELIFTGDQRCSQ